MEMEKWDGDGDGDGDRDEDLHEDGDERKRGKGKKGVRKRKMAPIFYLSVHPIDPIYHILCVACECILDELYGE